MTLHSLATRISKQQWEQRGRRDILADMSSRRVTWSLLLLALLCLVPVAAGIALLLTGTESNDVAGWALVGFFGSGVVVLGHKAWTSP